MRDSSNDADLLSEAEYEHSVHQHGVQDEREIESVTVGNDRSRRGNEQLVCVVCSYKWESRKDSKPQKCPRCRSTKWNQEYAVKNQCAKCSHQWRARTPYVKRCPACQSVKWNSGRKDPECMRCGHTWATKSEKTPKRCPSCKSLRWNEEVVTFKCVKCGHARMMKSNSRNGELCPVCDAKVQECRCVQCGHKWKSSRSRIPKKCKSCGSHNWSEQAQGL